MEEETTPIKNSSAEAIPEARPEDGEHPELEASAETRTEDAEPSMPDTTAEVRPADEEHSGSETTAEVSEKEETPGLPAAAELSPDQIKTLARELAKEMTPPEEPEPTPEEKKALLKEQKAARRKKNRRRRLRALRDLIIRALLLAVVMYVLFFHLVGVTIMPSGDMYPRIDAGDLVLFYRLDHTILAQDIIVFEKATSALEAKTSEAEGTDEAEEPAETTEQENAVEEAAEPKKEEIAAQPILLQKQENEEAAAQPQEAEESQPEEAWWEKALHTVEGWYWTARRWLGFKDPDAEPTTMFICRVVAAPGDVVEITTDNHLLVNGNAVVETNIFYLTPQYYGFMEYPVTLHAGEYFVLADYRNGGADSRFFGVVNEDEILGTVITIVRRNNL